MLKIILASSLVLLSGCVNNNPTLMNHVERKGDGIYTISSALSHDPFSQATKQCKLDGDKKFELISTSSEYNYYLKQNDAVYIFECIDKKA